jgi:lactoylglutathione lyase
VVDLAKDRIDVGFYTSRYVEAEAFWGETVGLAYEELLKVGNGVHQHRYGVRGSVCKVNSARVELPDAPTAYRRLVVARDGQTEPELLYEPDGTEVELVPPGHDGVVDLAVHWATRDPEELGRLLVEGFGAAHEGGTDHRIGTSLLRLVRDPDVPPVEGMFARGFRYLTVQVRDVRKEHAHLLSAGWTEGRPPVKLGETAFISFVRDPGGSWIEVSQRASLTGPLPED